MDELLKLTNHIERNDYESEFVKNLLTDMKDKIVKKLLNDLNESTKTSKYNIKIEIPNDRKTCDRCDRREDACYC